MARRARGALSAGEGTPRARGARRRAREARETAGGARGERRGRGASERADGRNDAIDLPRGGAREGRVGSRGTRRGGAGDNWIGSGVVFMGPVKAGYAHGRLLGPAGPVRDRIVPRSNNDPARGRGASRRARARPVPRAARMTASAAHARPSAWTSSGTPPPPPGTTARRERRGRRAVGRRVRRRDGRVRPLPSRRRGEDARPRPRRRSRLAAGRLRRGRGAAPERHRRPARRPPPDLGPRGRRSLGAPHLGRVRAGHVPRRASRGGTRAPRGDPERIRAMVHLPAKGEEAAGEEAFSSTRREPRETRRLSRVSRERRRRRRNLAEPRGGCVRVDRPRPPRVGDQNALAFDQTAFAGARPDPRVNPPGSRRRAFFP